MTDHAAWAAYQRSLGPFYLNGSASALPLGPDTIDCAVDSPPYFGLRVYGDSADEPGRGGLNDYIEEMVEHGRQVRSVLKDTGTWWLNIGDTAANSGGAGGDHTDGSKKAINYYKQGETGIKGNQWGMVPWRVAMALQDDGWLLRAHVVWNKTVIKPESLTHCRRPGVMWEPLFMFAKTPKYKFYPDGLIERGNVWNFTPSRGKGHQAPFPDELPRRCILCSTVEGDTVLDRYSGSGTTARVAASLGRRGIGVELYHDVARDAASREEPIKFTSSTAQRNE